MQGNFKRKMWDVSSIAASFGANASDCRKGFQSYANLAIPKSWKPTMIFGGIWEEAKSGVYGQMSHVLRLSNFPYVFSFKPNMEGEEEADQAHLKLYKEIRNLLWDWIFKTKGMDYPAPNGGGIWAGIGDWFLNYRLQNFEGTYSVWITPSGERSATLVATLIEARIRKFTK